MKIKMKKKLKKYKRNNLLNISLKEEPDKSKKSYNFKIKSKKRKKTNIKSKIILNILFPFFLFLISIILFLFYSFTKKQKIRNTEDIVISRKSNPYENKGFDFENNTFNIINKKDCRECGFFSYYIYYLGCFITTISSERIPIIDLSSFPNVFNDFNPTDTNLWEYFFEQPYYLTLNEIKEKAKKKDIIECGADNNMIPNYKDIYSKIYSLNFYHNFVKKYIPIKKEILEEVKNIMKKLIKNSENVLGALVKENDDKNAKIKEYPSNIKLIDDVKNFNNENKYDFIFLTTDDNKIKDNFIKEFGEKVKFLDLTNKKNYFSSNKISEGLELQKIYLFNILILSECIDIISVPTYETVATFILSKGFRNSLVYNL